MNIPYSHSVHSHSETALETALAEHMPAHEFAKSVVYFNGSRFGIAVVPADLFADLKRIARAEGVPSVRLANESELKELFPNSELGAMPPFGDSCELPVLVDRELFGDYIAFAIGTHREVVRMSFVDFTRIAKPKLATVALREMAARA